MHIIFIKCGAGLGSIIDPTVVNFKNNQKGMIISRFPLMEKDGEVGYFDYAACAFPQGKVSNQDLFFNTEDIEEINFRRCSEFGEKEYSESLKEQLNNIDYPHFHLD